MPNAVKEAVNLMHGLTEIMDVKSVTVRTSTGNVTITVQETNYATQTKLNPTPAMQAKKIRLTPVMKAYIRETDKVCAYCREARATTVDHIHPTSRGGSNAEWNLVGCCEPCNIKKADLHPREAGMVLRMPLRLAKLALAV